MQSYPSKVWVLCQCGITYLFKFPTNTMFYIAEHITNTRFYIAEHITNTRCREAVARGQEKSRNQMRDCIE